MKFKVQAEIAKVKMMWTKKTSSANLWKAVNVNLGSKSSNPIMSLLSQYESITDGVEAINKAMASVFLPKSSISLDSHVCTNVHEDWNVLITPAIISKLFMCLPSSKASPDLPVKLYKSAATRTFLA